VAVSSARLDQRTPPDAVSAPVVPAHVRAAGWGRLAAGLALALVALALPWLGSPLHHGLAARQLRLRIPGLPGSGRLSYAVPVLVLAVAAAASAWRHRSPGTLGVRLAGWAMIGTAGAFFILVRTGDARLLFQLRSAATQYSIISRLFGYTNSSYLPPTSVLGHQTDATTTLVFDDLRLGWFALGAAGIVLAGRVRLGGRGAHALAGGVLVVVAVLGYGIGRGLYAQQQKLDGIAAERDGRPGAAVAALHYALRLNPSLSADPDLLLALGEAELDLGEVHTPLAQYAIAETQPTPSATQETALLAGPPRSVITERIEDLVAAGGAPTALLLYAAPQAGSNVALAYRLGRYFYTVGADVETITFMRTALGETDAADVRSSCLTYIALAELREGDDAGFRRYLIAAVKADPLAANTFAREISAGLYVPGTP